jgi:hypothetical protein
MPSSDLHPLRVEKLLPFALLAVAEVEDPHRVKAALALNALRLRFPEWTCDQAKKLLEHAQFFDTPAMAGPITPQLNSPIKYGPRAAERFMTAAVFPLAYRAAQDWVDQVGLAAVMMHFRQRAISEPSYLAHRLSIWLSFIEAEKVIVDPLQRALLLERFVEFLAHAFHGAAEHHAVSAELLDFASVLKRCARFPGFFAHHLIALAWLYKADLDQDDKQLAYQSIASTVLAQYGETDERLLTSLPWQECSDEAWSQHLLQFTLHLRSNIHIATVAEALSVLWDASDLVGRSELLNAMDGLIAE